MAEAASMTEPTDAEAERMLQGLLGPIGKPVTMTVELGAVRRMALAVAIAPPFDPSEFNTKTWGAPIPSL